MSLNEDNLVKLEASQDEMDTLNYDATSELSLETSQETQDLKKQLHSKNKQYKKAAKQVKIQDLQSQIAATDEQLEKLQQKKASQCNDTRVSRPVISSTSQPSAPAQSSRVQQADLDVRDVFLNQLDEPIKEQDGTSKPDKPSRSAKK